MFEGTSGQYGIVIESENIRIPKWSPNARGGLFFTSLVFFRRVSPPHEDREENHLKNANVGKHKQELCEKHYLDANRQRVQAIGGVCHCPIGGFWNVEMNEDANECKLYGLPWMTLPSSTFN